MSVQSSENFAERASFLQTRVYFPDTGQTLLSILDTGSNISLIPLDFLKYLQYSEVQTKKEELNVRQTQGMLRIIKIIEVSAQIGNHTEKILMYVIDSNLPYILISLQHMSLFRLDINLREGKIYQGDKDITCYDVNAKQESMNTYYLNKVDEISKRTNKINQNCNNDELTRIYDIDEKSNCNEDNSKCEFIETRIFYNKNVNNNSSEFCKLEQENIQCNDNACVSKESITDVNLPQPPQLVMDLPHLSENLKSHLAIQECIPGFAEMDQTTELASLIRSFKHIFSKDKFDIGRIRMDPAKVILTSETPISLRPYRASQKDNAEIKQQIDELLKHDIIKPSYSPYSSPVTLAQKRGEGKTRLCVDYRKINEICKTDKEPIPRIDGILDQLSQARIFSTLDITSAYWNIALEEKSKEKLAFTCNFGLYEFQVLPFGYKNSPAIFQRVIRQILNKYQVKFALNYFDDVVIFSNNLQEHLEHLKTIFQICEKENIKLKFSKCQLAQTKISFLGYEIGEGTFSPNDANVETIKKIVPPCNIKQLQGFLGSVNVYNKFIHNYAKLRKPLNNLLKKDVKWVWDDECQKAYETLKNCLISKPILSIYNPNYPCSLFVDASGDGIGSVLKQLHPDGNLHPVAYHSRSLRPYEKNYSVSELECLAIIDSVEKFHCYLHGTKFTIYTDHAALVWLKSIKHLTGRLFRWSLKLSMYDYTIKYKKGSTNHEADFLSRQPISHFVNAQVNLLNIEEIREHQQLDNMSNPKFKKVNEVLTIQKKGLTKIVVPFSLRLKLMENAHIQFGHPGVQKMLQILSPIYYWESIIVDVSNYVKFCEICQLNKKCHQKRFGLLQSLPPAKLPFELMSLDTIGGLGYYHSTKKYLHCITDHSTRYVWTFASTNATTDTYVNCLKQIFQIAKPKKLLSDRNAAFTSTKFKHFLKNNGVTQLLTSSHRPQCNGKQERVGATIVQRMRCKLNSEASNTPWPKILEQVTAEYNNTPHQVTSFPPNYLLYGTLPYESPLPNMEIYPPLEQAREIAYDRTLKDHEKNKVRYDKRFLDSPFKEGDIVMVENFVYPNTRKLTSPFDGPYTIIKKISDVTFEIDKPNYLTKKKTDIIHSTRLRFFNSADNFNLVQRPSKIPVKN